MNPTVLRIVDANLNRAREALRVVEDYARFVLDDGTLCGELKELRHELAAATAPWADRAMLMRDTPGDVGTANSTELEYERPGLAAVVTAAGKRMGEALRTIEEYLKTVSPAEAARVELIRYQFYDVELRVARTLHAAERFADVRLYVLITEAVCRRPWLEVAEAAIEGGADCLQLREKTLEGAELLRRAKALVMLCRSRRVLCIVNDRADVAVLADADGVHVGQGDLPAVEARKIVGPDKLVGVSTHDIEQARRAVTDGADYVGVGPVFRSSTKAREILPGLEFAREVAREVSIPAVAIAGITEGNLEQVLETGVRAVAVTAAVAASEDPRAAAAGLKLSIKSNLLAASPATRARGR
jgi:thiamine-phosphate pyrophosphorylase